MSPNPLLDPSRRLPLPPAAHTALARRVRPARVGWLLGFIDRWLSGAAGPPTLDEDGSVADARVAALLARAGPRVLWAYYARTHQWLPAVEALSEDDLLAEGEASYERAIAEAERESEERLARAARRLPGDLRAQLVAQGYLADVLRNPATPPSWIASDLARTAAALDAPPPEGLEHGAARRWPETVLTRLGVFARHGTLRWAHPVTGRLLAGVQEGAARRAGAPGPTSAPEPHGQALPPAFWAFHRAQRAAWVLLAIHDAPTSAIVGVLESTPGRPSGLPEDPVVRLHWLTHHPTCPPAIVTRLVGEHACRPRRMAEALATHPVGRVPEVRQAVDARLWHNPPDAATLIRIASTETLRALTAHWRAGRVLRDALQRVVPLHASFMASIWAAARPEQRACCTVEDLAPFFTATSPQIRQQALTWLGDVQGGSVPATPTPPPVPASPTPMPEGRGPAAQYR